MAGVSNISLFAPQLADVERQRQMAELLQQQSNSPIEIQSYKGTQAPIPTMAVLAKALEGYAAARKRGQADKAERTLRQKEEDIRTSEAAAADEAYRTGVYTPPQIDKTAPTDANMAPPSRTMQLAKALGLGDVANRIHNLMPGQAAPQGAMPTAPAAAPPMPQPAMPQPVMPQPAMPPIARAPLGTTDPRLDPTGAASMSAPAMGIAPGTPPVVQKPAPTLQDRQQAYYQALSHSRDPSVAASARDHLMQLEERQATNQAITGLVSPESPNYKAVQAALAAGDVKAAMELARDETPTRTQLIENLSSLTPLSGMTSADMRRLATIDPEGFSKSYMTGFLQSIKPENRTDENDAFVEWHRANPRGTWLDFHRLWEQAGFKPAGASGGAKGAVTPRLGGGLAPGAAVPAGGQVIINGGG